MGGGRNARQCRDRWVNYLAPNIKKNEWSEEEDFVIIFNYQNFGTKWAKIATLLQGRSENHIKNRWHSFLKRKFEYDSHLTKNQIRALVHDIHTKQQLDRSKSANIEIPSPQLPPPVNQPIFEEIQFQPPPPPPPPPQQPAPVQVVQPQARPPRVPPKSMSPATALVQLFKRKAQESLNLFY